jgi:hypothetical protein
LTNLKVCPIKLKTPLCALKLGGVYCTFGFLILKIIQKNQEHYFDLNHENYLDIGQYILEKNHILYVL